MKELKIVYIAGARPNFMKIAPLMRVLAKYPFIKQRLIHTGQHYDKELSGLFFRDLGLPRPDINLNVGSLPPALQITEIILKLDPVLSKEKPGLVVVVGDVNSTLAGALAAAENNIPLAHVEAGLRSFDRNMPEEINRIITDKISDYLFVTEDSGIKNLRNENIPKEKAYLVGNVMIDTLLSFKKLSAKSRILHKLRLRRENYGILTLHRPSNVDRKEDLLKILNAVKEITKTLPLIFPCHPRTLRRIKEFSLQRYFDVSGSPGKNRDSKIRLIEPLGYLDFMKLFSCAKMVLTDSGGIQEEAVILRVPCITLRDSTERPSTLKSGINVLTGNDKDKIMAAVKRIVDRRLRKPKKIRLWDGKAAQRIARIIINKLG